MSEMDLLREIQVAMSGFGCRLLRNNNGVAMNSQGRPVRFGLGVGSSDLIGWTPVVITPQMVGKTLAVFTAAEVKASRGKLTDDQANFLAAVDAAGGIAVMAKTIESVIRGVKKKRGLPLEDLDVGSKA